MFLLNVRICFPAGEADRGYLLVAEGVRPSGDLVGVVSADLGVKDNLDGVKELDRGRGATLLWERGPGDEGTEGGLSKSLSVRLDSCGSKSVVSLDNCGNALLVVDPALEGLKTGDVSNESE